MRWTRIFIEASLLVAAAILLGAGSNLVAPKEKKLDWIDKYESPSLAPLASYPVPSPSTHDTDLPADARAIAPPKDPGQIYLEISGEIVRRPHSSGALFIDARRSEAYEKGHIAGARSIAVWEQDADAKVAALLLEKLPFEQVIVLYCSGGDCQDSALLSQKLAMSGYYNLYVYKDGYPEWEKRRWPVEQGRTP